MLKDVLPRVRALESMADSKNAAELSAARASLEAAVVAEEKRMPNQFDICTPSKRGNSDLKDTDQHKDDWYIQFHIHTPHVSARKDSDVIEDDCWYSKDHCDEASDRSLSTADTDSLYERDDDSPLLPYQTSQGQIDDEDVSLLIDADHKKVTSKRAFLFPGALIQESPGGLCEVFARKVSTVETHSQNKQADQATLSERPRRR